MMRLLSPRAIRVPGAGTEGDGLVCAVAVPLQGPPRITETGLNRDANVPFAHTRPAALNL